MTSPRIVTNYNPPSTPGNARDWSAVDDRTYGGEPGDLIGYGATEAEAVEDLLWKIEEGGI